MRIQTIILLCLLILPVSAFSQYWKLEWSDEFDGDVLDQTKWSFMTGTGVEYGIPDWGNNEMQYYQEANAVVSDGMLTITARRENVGGKQFTSARLRTMDKGDWKYCRIEFRAKMPLGKGLWAAIWMLPTDNAYGGWAASGELDFVEYLGDVSNKIYGTLHFGGAWPNNTSKGTNFVLDSGDFHTAFHDFALEWEEGKIRWYVDEQLYQTLDQGDWWTTGFDFPAPFDKRFHLLINLAVGGNWPGAPDGTTQFPQDLVLDYVRIYQWDTTSTNIEPKGVADDFQLDQNYPNPFCSGTKISYFIPEPEHITLELYDAAGRLVETLVDDQHLPGKYSINLDGSNISPGLYTYRLTSGRHQKTKQMVLLVE